MLVFREILRTYLMDDLMLTRRIVRHVKKKQTKGRNVIYDMSSFFSRKTKITRLTFFCSRSSIQTLEKVLKYVQS